jgi:hypothetical protein
VAVNSLRNFCSEELQAESYFPENYLHGTGIFVPGRDGLFGQPGRVHLDTPTTGSGAARRRNHDVGQSISANLIFGRDGFSRYFMPKVLTISAISPSATVNN